MPLTLTLTESVIPQEKYQDAIKKITNAMLKWHGLSENPVMKPNVTASVHELPQGTTFSGGELVKGVWVEWKVPSFAFVDRDVQTGFFAETTEIIHALSGGKLAKENIYINVVHAVDGAWNFNGVALTNEAIAAEIAQG